MLKTDENGKYVISSPEEVSYIKEQIKYFDRKRIALRNLTTLCDIHKDKYKVILPSEESHES